MIVRSSRTKCSCSCKISSAFRVNDSSSESLKRYRVLDFGVSFTEAERDVGIFWVSGKVVDEDNAATWSCV